MSPSDARAGSSSLLCVFYLHVVRIVFSIQLCLERSHKGGIWSLFQEPKKYFHSHRKNEENN